MVTVGAATLAIDGSKSSMRSCCERTPSSANGNGDSPYFSKSLSCNADPEMGTVPISEDLQPAFAHCDQSRPIARPKQRLRRPMRHHDPAARFTARRSCTSRAEARAVSRRFAILDAYPTKLRMRLRRQARYAHYACSLTSVDLSFTMGPRRVLTAAWRIQSGGRFT